MRLLSEELDEARAYDLYEALELFLWEHADPEDVEDVAVTAVVFLEEAGWDEEELRLCLDAEVLGEDHGSQAYLLERRQAKRELVLEKSAPPPMVKKGAHRPNAPAMVKKGAYRANTPVPAMVKKKKKPGLISRMVGKAKKVAGKAKSKVKASVGKLQRDVDADLKGASRIGRAGKALDSLTKKGGVKRAAVGGLKKGLKMVFGKWVKIG